MCLKLCFVLLLLPIMAQRAAALSAETKKVLLKGLNGKNLEDRRARLQHLSTLYSKNRPIVKNQNKTTEELTEGSATEPDNEPSIEKINENEGVSDYLFQSDINLSEEQLGWIEESISKNESTRNKRQVREDGALWADNTVNYWFDVSIDAAKRSVITKAFNYLQARTCINFVASEVAPNRLHFFNGDGCWSSVGMMGGVQYISIPDGCKQVGIIAHELMHALGVWHMQMRDDRDDYIQADLTNVMPGMEGNFVKYPTINYNPYEYGSSMHYRSNAYTTTGDSLIPFEGRYLNTLGSRITSFYDIKTINDHYKCIDQCQVAPAACTNGGIPNPRNCATCVCPNGYGGALCGDRPTGCGSTLTATARWQVRQFTFGSAAATSLLNLPLLCNHWIKAPAGKQVQVRVTYVKEPKCQKGCNINAIEPKIKADSAITNARICCTNLLNYVLTSELNPTPIVAYNRLKITTFTFHYRFI
ncbi:hypothetical protein RB195_009241 [Necator americanus]